MVFSLFGKKQGLEALYQFVKQQLAKKSARKSKEGIATLFKDTDSVVQSNVKRIEEILKSHGYDASKMSANDILKAMNYHKALMDQRMNFKFEAMGLSKGVDDLAKKPPFQGFTPTIVKDKTLFKDSPERIAKMKADNKAAIERLKKKKKTVEDFSDDGDFDPGGMASGGLARVGMFSGGPIRLAKGASWVINKLKEQLFDLDLGIGGSSFSKLSSTQKEGFKNELKTLIKQL